MPDVTKTEIAAHHPKAIYLKDYQLPNYLIDEVDLHVDLYEEHTLVTSRLRVHRHADCKNGSTDWVLNGDELTLESIKINNKKLNTHEYVLTPESLTLKNMPEVAEIEIITRLHPEKNTALSGLYRSNNTYCTQCEAEGFRRITYFADHPDILSVYSTTITANHKTHPMLLSNGNLVASGKTEDGRHWAKWVDPFKKPSYLFALVAGDFDLVTDQFVTQSGRKIDLRIYVDKGYKDQTAHAMYSLKTAMRWDEVAYGREYDLDIYMIVAIGDFNMGAMENKGLNIFNTKYVLAKAETATDDDRIHILSVIGHEYFHNWSGNRVTCRDWFQLSLKEGLTIFRDQSFSEDTLSHAVMRIRDVIDLRESQFTEDAGPLAHPVRPDSYIEINNFYTATIYNKGAEVLRMLQTLLGKPLFRRGMDLYFSKYDGQAVTIEDYVKVMEEISGKDLTQFRRWYSQAGTPVVTVVSSFDKAKKQYSLTFTQMTPPTPGQSEKQPLHIPVAIALFNQQGDEIKNDLLELTHEKQTFVFDDISDLPVPSLLRNFSAPVKLKYNYTDPELMFLAKRDTDAFNRWEAVSQYLLRILIANVRRYQQGESLVVDAGCVDIFSHLLTEKSDDLFLTADMLQVPSENYIGEQLDVVDVDAIHAAREHLLLALASQLENLFLKRYEESQASVQDTFDIKQIGQRQLKNRCLSFLLLSSSHVDLGVRQFMAAYQSNMTDTIPALVGLCGTENEERQKALDLFYATWKHDALVIDKWLALQATCKLPGTLTNVKKLMRHESFDIKNPNKVYALIGAFGHRNAIHFHAKDGSGYEFLREVVQELDRLNPQVAGRMVKPLTNWRRHDKERQALMRQQLQALLSNKLSTDLYELVTKSL